MSKNTYQVIQSSYLTEKSSYLTNSSNQYTFKVDINSSKKEIKKAVESYFSVDVKKVRVVKVKGKTKQSRYRLKKRPNWKKAYVSLAENQSIDVGME
tara:strand:- start:53 stop:343 length:291 start_codon:yes stop_codon:yes gene_type:complete